VASNIRQALDVGGMAGGRGGADDASTKMVDDGTGELQVWRVEKFGKAPVDAATYGQFYAGDSYVMVRPGVKRSTLVYRGIVSVD